MKTTTVNEGHKGKAPYMSKLKSKPFKTLLLLFMKKYGTQTKTEEKTGICRNQIHHLLVSSLCSEMTAKKILKHYKLIKAAKK